MPRIIPAFVILTAALTATSARAAELAWSFDDGDMEGWEVIQSDPTVPLTYSSQFTGDFGIDEQPVDFWGLFPDSWGPNRDSEHATLIVRSPSFTLDASADATVTIVGGMSAGTSHAAELPGSAADLASATDLDDGIHAMGVALRRVSDGAYLMIASRSDNAEDQEVVTFLAEDLAAHDGERVAFEIFDSFVGRWSWIGVSGATAQGQTGPVVTIDGACPGVVGLDVAGITPDGTFAVVRAAAEGEMTVPAGGCAGTALDLDPESVQMLGIFRADDTGAFAAAPFLPPAICGQAHQVVDLTTCDVTALGTF